MSYDYLSIYPIQQSLPLFSLCMSWPLEAPKSVGWSAGRLERLQPSDQAVDHLAAARRKSARWYNQARAKSAKQNKTQLLANMYAKRIGAGVGWMRTRTRIRIRIRLGLAWIGMERRGMEWNGRGGVEGAQRRIPPDRLT